MVWYNKNVIFVLKRSSINRDMEEQQLIKPADRKDDFEKGGKYEDHIGLETV